MVDVVCSDGVRDGRDDLYNDGSGPFRVTRHDKGEANKGTADCYLDALGMRPVTEARVRLAAQWCIDDEC